MDVYYLSLLERSCGRWEGRDLKVKANARIIEQAVENISGDVTLRFSNDLGPFSISNDKNDYIAVLRTYAPGRK
jgi:hypothetical protein